MNARMRSVVTASFLFLVAPVARAQPAGANAAEAEPKAVAQPAGANAAEAEPKTRAGFFRGQGFRIESADGNYSFRPGLQAAVKTEIVTHQDADPTLPNPFPFLRPRFDGNLYRKWINYWVSMELGRDPPYLLDAYLELGKWDTFKVRMGQQWTALSRHEDMGPQQLLFPTSPSPPTTSGPAATRA